MTTTIEKCCGVDPPGTMEGPYNNVAVLTCPVCGRRVELGLVERERYGKCVHPVDVETFSAKLDEWNKGVNKNGG